MNRVEDGNLSLIAKIPLTSYQRKDKHGKVIKHTKNMSMAICFPLS